MSKIGTWNTSAGNNNATPPDGWPEGQAPSTVNDCAREMMAQIKTYVNDAQYVDLGNTPSFKTATTFSMATADTTNFEIGRRVKLFDTTVLYGTINSVSATFVSVRLDSGALSTSLSSVAMSIARNTAPMAPMSVLRNKNMIINGQFDVWQRGAPLTSIANGQYLADRFKYEAVNTAVLNCGRLERSANTSNVPTLLQTGVFLNSAMVVSVSATDVAIASADCAFITYTMEGYDWKQIAHKPLGLSFWARTNCSGIYAVALRSGANSVSLVNNFTIDTINTWQRFFVPLSKAPTAFVTWDYSGGAGLKVSWTLASGGDFKATNNQWTAMNAIATSSQVNFLATVGNHFELTGVCMTEGSADTMCEVRPITQELHACQRYYEAGTSTLLYTANAVAEELRVSVQFTVDKRTAPTIVLAGGALTNATLSTAINATTNKFDHRLVGTNPGNVAIDGTFFTADAEF